MGRKESSQSRENLYLLETTSQGVDSRFGWGGLVSSRGVQPLFERFRDSFDSLSPKQQDLVQYIIQNPSFSSYATARELGARVGADASTVVRLAQTLGFKGYSHFRHSLRHFYQDEMAPPDRQDKGLVPSSPFARQIVSDLRNLREALEILDEEGLQWLASKIATARHVLVLSAGSYSALATVLSHLCAAIGYPVRAETRGGPYVAPAVTTLVPEDFLLVIGLWRAARDQVLALEWAKANGIPNAALTDTVFSPIARIAERAIIIPSEGNLFFQSLVPGLSVVYGLVSALWELDPERGERKLKETRQFHKDQGLELD